MVQEIASLSPVSINALVKMSEISLDKELAVNSLVETCTKLGKLILAVMVL